jgi:hypothetical protein
MDDPGPEVDDPVHYTAGLFLNQVAVAVHEGDVGIGSFLNDFYQIRVYVDFATTETRQFYHGLFSPDLMCPHSFISAVSTKSLVFSGVKLPLPE